MVAPSSTSSLFNVVLTTDRLDLRTEGNASSEDLVTTFKLANCLEGYRVLHTLQSREEAELTGSSKLPQAVQKIKEPTTDIFNNFFLISSCPGVGAVFLEDAADEMRY